MLQVLHYQLMQRLTKTVTLSSCSYLWVWLFAWQVSSCSSTTTKPDTKERLTTVMKTPTPAAPLAAKSPTLAWKSSTIPTSTCQAKDKPWKEGRMGQTGGPIQIMVSKYNWKYQKWSLCVCLFQVNTFICPGIFLKWSVNHYLFTHLYFFIFVIKICKVITNVVKQM